MQKLEQRETIHFNAQMKSHLQGILILFSASFMVQKFLSYQSESTANMMVGMWEESGFEGKFYKVDTQRNGLNELYILSSVRGGELIPRNISNCLWSSFSLLDSAFAALQYALFLYVFKGYLEISFIKDILSIPCALSV